MEKRLQTAAKENDNNNHRPGAKNDSRKTPVTDLAKLQSGRELYDAMQSNGDYHTFAEKLLPNQRTQLDLFMMEHMQNEQSALRQSIQREVEVLSFTECKVMILITCYLGIVPTAPGHDVLKGAGLRLSGGRGVVSITRGSQSIHHALAPRRIHYRAVAGRSALQGESIL